MSSKEKCCLGAGVPVYDGSSHSHDVFKVGSLEVRVPGDDRALVSKFEAAERNHLIVTIDVLEENN